MYTLAIDRGDEEVAKIYDPAHLSVLKLIKLSADSAKKEGILLVFAEKWLEILCLHLFY